MSTSLCKTSVFKAYQDVMADVISNVREHFIEDGVDESVLQDLKHLWETKLATTKAVTENKEAEKVVAANNNKTSKPHEIQNGNQYVKNPTPTVQQIQMQQHQLQQQQMQQQQHIQQQLQQQLLNKQVVGQVAPNNHMPQGMMAQAYPEWRRVPIQLTIPSAPGSADSHRILSIDVPEVFLQGPHLKSILTGQVISTTMELPLMAACAFLQNHVNLAFHKHQESFFAMNNGAINPNFVQNNAIGQNKMDMRFHDPPPPPQRDGAADSSDNDSIYNNLFRKTDTTQNDLNLMNRIQQADGPADQSDEDDVYQSDEQSENDDPVNGDADEMEEDAIECAEEEPLNSEDDISDADGTEESFETDNVIVCQYDKITRSRNRWKFHLKDGIMSLRGEDFIFQKANGDAEW